MTPEDLAEVKSLLRTELEYKEPWSWSKFLKGFFDGKNYAKAIVLGVCFIIVLIIIFSVHGFISSKLHKAPPPSQTVGENKGIIATNNEDKQGNSYSLLNLFNWR